MKRVAILCGILAVGVWLMNTSAFMAPPSEDPTFLAHRGVHQTYAGPAPGRDTCTAQPVHPSTHGLIENTLPSMRAAFEAGADIVEIDVHLTPDNVFAVFHDWTLDCRTDGAGQTNKTLWADLQALDVGYHYSHDARNFPYRGTGVGLMPRLEEVFTTFPNRQFLINFKSNRLSEGKALMALLDANPDWHTQIWGVYGGAKPSYHVAANTGTRGFDKAGVKACLTRYIALGWSGHVPQACHDTVVLVPINIAPWLWGWPLRFQARMQREGTDVILVGPYASGSTAGIDDTATMARVPAGFGGLIWTNRIEVIAR